MCIWCLEPLYKLKTEMYSVSERHEHVKFKYVHLVSRSHEQANTEMYIWCLEPLNKLNKMHISVFILLSVSRH
jgi:hypothetical protein